MLKYPEEQRNVSVPPPGRWVWSDETRTVEFVSAGPTEEGVLRTRGQTFTDLQQRAEWLAEVCTLNGRGRQSIRKSLSPAHLNAYRASVMKRQRDHITTDDVKQVAVSLLQENYSLPIPFCFLAILKSKELDEVLAALLLYLSCFFELKSLEDTSKSLMVVDITSEHRIMMEALAKRDIAQKKLAVCYFSFIMDLELEQHQHASHNKKDLREIQEEVGRLLYSDTFNTAVRKRTDGVPGMTVTDVNGSVKTEEDDPKETECNSTFMNRTSQRRPALSSIVNQRSPLMVSLLPSPKERSPHLFLSSRARRQSPQQAKHCHTKALTEQLNEQLASVSSGILGMPLKQFSRSTLIPNGSTTHTNTRNSAATTEAVTSDTE